MRQKRIWKAAVSVMAAAVLASGIPVAAMAGTDQGAAVIDRTTKLEPELERESERPVKTGWVTDEIGTRYLLEDGTYLTNVWFQEKNANWYFLNEDGYQLTGWQNIDGVEYYFEQDGHMLIGWQKIGGEWYFFEFLPDSSRGLMYADQQTPDGYMTDSDGVIQ